MRAARSAMQAYQPGFTRQNWNNWFAAEAGQSATSGVVSALWYIRSYANYQQVPTSQHSIFLRANWVDAFVPYLDLRAIVSILARIVRYL